MNSKIDISIVIVNYNVKDFLKDCLNSIYKSNFTGIYETIVVDNNSDDNSVSELSTSFPHVKFIQLNENLGFSKANNIGFKEAKGEFLLILNPDTILNSDTIQKTYDFYKSKSNIGAVGCKVLNEDLSFQLACRRSFPTPWNSFCKLFGLQNIFPKSKLFSKYNLTYLDENQTYEVDALIGAFIFTKKSILDEINGFDEEYFMYGEDLDLCFKIKEKNYNIYYFHETSIIHFKGESTKRSNINEVKHFYDAMQIFVKKHYSHSFIFLLFLKYGIKIREIISYLNKFKLDILLIVLDLLLVFIIFPIANKLRYGNFDGFPVENYFTYLIVVSVFAVFSQFISGNYFEKEINLRKGLISGILTLLSVGFFIYLIRGFDLSRIVLLITSMSFGIISFLMRKLFFNNFKNSVKNFIIVGENELSQKVFSELTKNNFNLFVSNNDNQTFSLLKQKKNFNVVLCDNSDIIDFKSKINIYSDKINSIINISDYKDFLFKYSISKSLDNSVFNKSKLDQYRIKFIKRFIDIFVSLLLLTLGLMILIFDKAKLKSAFLMLKGDLSLVGLKNTNKKFDYKNGLFSLADLNNSNSDEDILELNKYYINNYSLTLDFDIFVKSIFNKER